MSKIEYCYICYRDVARGCGHEQPIIEPNPVPARYPEPGTNTDSSFGDGGTRFPPMSREPGTTHSSLYADIGALLREGLPDPEAPDMLTRNDGVGLFYRGQVNLLFGDPECGKTWVALAAVSETLRDGGTGLVLDLDHNGKTATISRLILLGAPVEALSDQTRFRYVEPEDSAHLLDVVDDVSKWKPDVTVLDSIGELLPLFGANSNSPDDFTGVHARVMKPLAMRANTALIAIDHLAKGAESRTQGATGTAAKKRAIGGVSLRVSVAEAYAPGRGGSSALEIHKDRHGGLRATCPSTDREPLAGMFVLSTVNGDTTWSVRAPSDGERAPDQAAPEADIDAIAALDPAPETVEDARARLKWRKGRAGKALRAYRERTGSTVPGSGPIGGNREPDPGSTVCEVCGDPSTFPIHPGCEQPTLAA